MTLTAPTIQTVTLPLHPLRKLIPLDVLAVTQGLKIKEAIALIEEGALFPAFNLATDPGTRKKLYIWRGILETWRPGAPPVKLSVDQVITAALPPLGVAPAASVTIRGTEIAFRFCLCNQRIRDLVRAGELCQAAPHNAINETPRITRPSVVAFLERRVL